MGNKQPISVLVVVHTADLQVLLLERADYPGSWQSVTGSREGEETPLQTARRELHEETGLDASHYVLSDWGVQNRYEIYPKWRHRYPDGVTHNTEHVFSLEIPAPCAIQLAPNEHSNYGWLRWQDAAPRCFSWSNRDAILALAEGRPGKPTE